MCGVWSWHLGNLLKNFETGAGSMAMGGHLWGWGGISFGTSECEYLGQSTIGPRKGGSGKHSKPIRTLFIESISAQTCGCLHFKLVRARMVSGR